MKSHKSINIGPSSAHQRNAKIGFRLWADGGPLSVVFGSTHQVKKKTAKKAFSKLDLL